MLIQFAGYPTVFNNTVLKRFITDLRDHPHQATPRILGTTVLMTGVAIMGNYIRNPEYFDKNGELIKVMKRENVKKVGEYWVAYKFSMKDIKKDHSTEMQLENIEFDKGLGDEIFSQRYLKRN